MIVIATPFALLILLLVFVILVAVTLAFSLAVTLLKFVLVLVVFFKGVSVCKRRTEPLHIPSTSTLLLCFFDAHAIPVALEFFLHPHQFGLFPIKSELGFEQSGQTCRQVDRQCSILSIHQAGCGHTCHGAESGAGHDVFGSRGDNWLLDWLDALGRWFLVRPGL